jgi:hypothetical protein
MTLESTPPLYKGKFIPDDPNRAPLPTRLLIGTGLFVVIVVAAFVSLNILNSWGVWVTLAFVSALAATGIVAWAVDSVRHPARLNDSE